MAERLKRFDRAEGVVFIGKAQEKAPVFRTEKRRDAHGLSYPWIVRSTAMVNQYYIYAVDRDFGPFFLKFCSYFPYNAKLCLNGHEYAKRQLAKAGIAFEALDNGIRSLRRPAASAENLRWPVGGQDRRSAAQVAAAAAASLHRRRPTSRLSLRHLHPAGRVLAHPGARPARARSPALRAGDPREPRPGPPRPSAADLRPQDQPHHARPLPHPRPDPGRHALPARRLQARPHQAVPQGRSRAQNRDHDQQHP